ATTASADPAASCSQSGATLTVNGNGGSVDVSRTEAGDLEFDSQPCGTVTTVDTVNISGLPTNPGVGVLFDMLHGLFAPGATLEADGSSEIEFNVTATPFVDQIYVDGRVVNDEITVG